MFGFRRIFWVLVAAASVACSDKTSTTSRGTGGVPSGGMGAMAGNAGTSAGAGAPASGAGGSNSGSGGATAGGSAGDAGGGTAGECHFTVEHAASTAIGTVEIVTFSVNLPSVAEARIEFGPTGSALAMTAPVDLDEPSYRTLLLGMKGERPYTFRVVARSGATTCTSDDFSFTTGPVASFAPTITKTMSSSDAAKGFIVTSPGQSLQGNGRIGYQPCAFIFDTDGDIVWWSEQTPDTTVGGSRAHMSWDGKTMWYMRGISSPIHGVSMDGMTPTDRGASVRGTHHDFTVLPDGTLAVAHYPVDQNPARFVEIAPDGTVTVIIADFGTLYKPYLLDGDLGTEPYPNAVHYHSEDDTYTVSDGRASLYARFKRSGELVWQLGGVEPLGDSFTLVGLDTWQNNHGHHLTSNGRFLFFNNGPNFQSIPTVFEVLLDEADWTATKTWEFVAADLISGILSDVQRLPNGNVLVTYSPRGLIQEVTPDGEVVQSFTSVSFGYADFRTSLYGPPLR